MLEASQAYLLFDSDCSVCRIWSRWAERIDKRNLYVIIPYQSIPETALESRGVTYADCAHSLQLIATNGSVQRGALAINRFLFNYPIWSGLVSLLYMIPVLLLVELAVYRLVARYRQLLSRWFELKPCSITAAHSNDNRHKP